MRVFCLHRYDVELFQRIETLIGKKLPVFPTQEEEVMMLMERVSEAQRFARIVSSSLHEKHAHRLFWSVELMNLSFSFFQEMKEQGDKRKRGHSRDEAADDEEQSTGVRKKVKGGSFRGGRGRGGQSKRGR